MLTNVQLDEFKAKLQTQMLDLAIKQAKAVLNDDYECAKEYQCEYRFLSLYLSVFTNPLYNYTSSEEEDMVNMIGSVAGLNEVVPISFTNYTTINTGTNHTHTISQVIGLQEALNDLQLQIDNMETTGLYIVEGGSADITDFHPSYRD
jgi:hypothetical protein